MMTMAEKMKTEKTKSGLGETRIYQDKNSPPWLQEIRAEAFAQFQKTGMPAAKWEAWKYTNLEKILKTSFREAGIAGHDESFPGVLPSASGVILESLAAAIIKRSEQIKPFLGASLKKESNPFVFLNTFNFQDGIFLYVPRNIIVEKPIELIFSGKGSGTPFFSPRILMVLEAGAQANIAVRHSSANSGAYFTNTVAEIYLGNKANLHWTQVDRESSEAVQFFTSRIHLQAESQLEMVSFTSGGDITRHETDVVLNGEKSSAWIGGLSLLLQNSEVSDIVTVKHQVSDGTSRQLFKNILGGHSQAEFTSLVHVGAGTHRSDSNQLNRNLILSDFAHAYSRPQLKIDSDDVQATHGSATGQLDTNELFYLKSRGLNPEAARFILTYGFAKEVLEKIKSAGLREELEKLVQEKLNVILRP